MSGFERSVIILFVVTVGALGCDDGTTPRDGGGDDGSIRSDAGQQVGCRVTPCSNGLMCCTGVPYPEEGLCAAECNLDSDRAIKTGLASVDAEEILDRVAALEVTEWTYRREPGVRHLGPMAQDFHAAFHIGGSDRHIHPVDANGVTLLAIQALYARVRRLEEENARLRAAHEMPTTRD